MPEKVRKNCLRFLVADAGCRCWSPMLVAYAVTQLYTTLLKTRGHLVKALNAVTTTLTKLKLLDVRGFEETDLNEMVAGRSGTGKAIESGTGSKTNTESRSHGQM
ncbi:MAG: hypothetical protein J3R72DRAFT_424955 [Linnemannia gamsii]|nr:MAG: hypothetical protein J3R72DRAFT_424955 [Linnemannia gamsii]